MENNFLYIDQQEINNKVTPVQSAISEFKSFYERYKKLNLKELQSEDLQEFFKTPKTFFLNVLTGGESLSVGQLKLDPEKVYDLSPRPSGVDESLCSLFPERALAIMFFARMVVDSSLSWEVDFMALS